MIQPNYLVVPLPLPPPPFHTALFTFVMVLARRIYLITKATVVGDHFLHSHNLDVCFSSNTVRRNRMLVTAGIQKG